jgi:hypothetical protein
MANRDVRDTAHAGGIFHALIHLDHVLHHGYQALRKIRSKPRIKKRERVVAYFVLHGILIALGQLREALNLLTELEPSLRDVIADFEEDLVLWTSFRDDAAHIVDRTHRASRPVQNDAVINQYEYGYDTDVLAYDYESDIVRTGLSDTMALRPAIGKVREIVTVLYESIIEGYGSGAILPPPRYR